VEAEALADDLVRRRFGGKRALIGQDEERDRRLERKRDKGEAKPPCAQLPPHPHHREGA